MSLKKVWIRNFRNIKEILVDFQDLTAPIFIHGKNNQGKSNFLMALYVLGNLKMPSGVKIQELLMEGQDESFVAVQKEIAGNQGDLKLYMRVKAKGLTVSMNTQKSVKKEQVREHFPVYFFSSDTLFSFTVSPSSRRELLDNFLCSYDSEYIVFFKNYQKVIQQKNKLLKKGHGDLRYYNQIILDLSTKIVERRKTYLAALEKHLTIMLRTLFKDNQLVVNLRYVEIKRIRI